MKPLPKLALLMLFLGILSGCSPYQPKVDVQADPAFTAGQFQSWGFAEPMSIEEAGYPEAIVAHFKNAVGTAMTDAGYERAEQPDLLIDVAALISGEGDAALNSDAYQAIHVQRGTFHNSWRGYGEGYGASTRKSRFGDGSINIGVIERQELELVWEAIATGRLSGDRSEEELATMIDSVTQQMLAELPRGG